MDEDGVYDPRSVNDRLLLGMKGTMSEMELLLLRQRSVEPLKLKAARGDLHTTVAVGYVRSEGDRMELNPDLRIREAISILFGGFALAGSVRQALLWFRQKHTNYPRWSTRRAGAVWSGGCRSITRCSRFSLIQSMPVLTRSVAPRRGADRRRPQVHHARPSSSLGALAGLDTGPPRRLY
ncbi:recombinase family protein [Burkholderia contaminans]|nr:hypothetical protein [Burkholderia contaminans]WFN15444.1 recombinase family protein [Burkholderia contaminans]